MLPLAQSCLGLRSVSCSSIPICLLAHAPCALCDHGQLKHLHCGIDEQRSERQRQRHERVSANSEKGRRGQCGRGSSGQAVKWRVKQQTSR